MSEPDQAIPDAPADATPVEKADVAVAKAVAPVAKTPAVKVLGWASEISDQPEMRLLCAGVIAAGLWQRDAKLAATGVRMLAAHSLATGIKTFIKNRIDRTRPNVLVEEGRYDMGAGDSSAHDETGFPSGHTAGAVSVAVAYAQVYPEHGTAAHLAAGAASLMQIPRSKHYASDVAVGAVIGWASAAIVGVASDAVADGLDKKRPRAGEKRRGRRSAARGPLTTCEGAGR